MPRPRVSPSGQYFGLGIGSSCGMRNAGAAQSFADGVRATAVMTVVDFDDPNDVFDPDLANNRILILGDARVLMIFGGAWAGAAAVGDRDFQIFEVSGAPVAVTPDLQFDTENRGFSASFSYATQVTEGDILELRCQQDTGAPIDLASAFFQLIQI